MCEFKFVYNLFKYIISHSDVSSVYQMFWLKNEMFYHQKYFLKIKTNVFNLGLIEKIYGDNL